MIGWENKCIKYKMCFVSFLGYYLSIGINRIFGKIKCYLLFLEVLVFKLNSNGDKIKIFNLLEKMNCK